MSTREKSLQFLKDQLRLRRAIERERMKWFPDGIDIEVDPFDYYAHERAVERIGELEAAIAEREQSA